MKKIVLPMAVAVCEKMARMSIVSSAILRLSLLSSFIINSFSSRNLQAQRS
jgi:hypothetical protein